MQCNIVHPSSILLSSTHVVFPWNLHDPRWRVIECLMTDPSWVDVKNSNNSEHTVRVALLSLVIEVHGALISHCMRCSSPVDQHDRPTNTPRVWDMTEACNTHTSSELIYRSRGAPQSDALVASSEWPWQSVDRNSTIIRARRLIGGCSSLFTFTQLLLTWISHHST